MGIDFIYFNKVYLNSIIIVKNLGVTKNKNTTNANWNLIYFLIYIYKNGCWFD